MTRVVAPHEIGAVLPDRYLVRAMEPGGRSDVEIIAADPTGAAVEDIDLQDPVRKARARKHSLAKRRVLGEPRAVGARVLVGRRARRPSPGAATVDGCTRVANQMRMLAVLIPGALLSAGAAQASESAAILNRIAEQAYNRSEVASTAAFLSDTIGARLTNSPAARRAEAWSQERFRSWGLAKVRAEGFEFGRGWAIESSSVRMRLPRDLTLRAIPIAWTPPTAGLITGPIILAEIDAQQDFLHWKGRLAGRIVLVRPRLATPDAAMPEGRWTAAQIREMNNYALPATDKGSQDRWFRRLTFEADLDRFLKAEGALAWVRLSTRNGGLVQGHGYLHAVGKTPALPAVELAAEDFRRLERLSQAGPVVLEIVSNVRYYDDDTRGYNIFAEIAGRDDSGSYVMAGAHLDSWAAGDGAADNAAGVAVVMEAARILAALKVKPRRAIRFVLWGAEEQGFFGSSSFIERYLAQRPSNPDPLRAGLTYTFKDGQYPVRRLPGYDLLAGYFNVDNGSGRLRGVYAEGNLSAVPMLQGWLEPLRPLGAANVVAQPTTGTDHQFMARLGLPAFQFIQDPLDYETTLNHTNLDTFDHLNIDDMKQASLVLASLLLSAAESASPLPSVPVHEPSTRPVPAAMPAPDLPPN